MTRAFEKPTKSGPIVVMILVAGMLTAGSSQAPAQTQTSLQIPATANIFGAGRDTPPAPAGNGAGTSPPSFSFPEAQGTERMSFTAEGTVTCCNTEDPVPYNGPGGGTKYSTNLEGYGWISGVNRSGMMFLVGVFLGPATPASAPPTDTATTAPLIGQVFLVGTGTEVAVPAGATRIFLGFADGDGFQGLPGYYSDNDGSVSAAVTLIPPDEGTPEKCPGYEDDTRPHIVGTAEDDGALTGTPADEIICGLGGTDTIRGEGGNDVLLGGNGDDTIIGGPDAELSDGGFGKDTIRARGNPAEETDDEAGVDVLMGGPDFDRLFGMFGSDVISVGDGGGFASGGSEDDFVIGGSGHDELEGDGGEDTIRGATGVDVIRGGPASDGIWGGGNNDHLFGEDGSDVIFGQENDDTIRGGPDPDLIEAGDGDDKVFGDTGPDKIDGQDGDDKIDGGLHSDKELRGGRGKDEVRGGPGADNIFGDDGPDYLDGGNGVDDISGGDGRDTCITDFRHRNWEEAAIEGEIDSAVSCEVKRRPR